MHTVRWQTIVTPTSMLKAGLPQLWHVIRGSFFHAAAEGSGVTTFPTLLEIHKMPAKSEIESSKIDTMKL